MRYNPEQGLFGNINRALKEITKSNNHISNNKAVQDCYNAETENLMCDLDDIDRIANIEEALLELEQMIEERNG